ncbi:hypothetical protein GCM10027174_04260 [Salinifilum aidingensis]
MVSDQHKAMIRAVSVIAAAVWVVLGLFGGWSYWLWGLLALLSLVGPSVVVHGVHEWKLCRPVSRPPQQPQPVSPQPVEVEQQAPPPPPQPPAFQEYRVDGVPFGSAESDYRLHLSCVVRWRPVQEGVVLEHQQPGAWAAECLLLEAGPVLELTLPEDCTRAKHRLASLLGARRTDQTGRMEFHADRISVGLSDGDRSRIDERKQVRKDAQLWSEKSDFERTVRSYLEQEVLDSPGSALVWWLASPRTEEKERVDDAVDKLPNLRYLAGAAAVRELPEPAVFRSEKEQDSRAVAGDGWSVSEPQMFDLVHQPVGNGAAGFVLPEQWTPPEVSEEDSALGPREHTLGLLDAQEKGPERDLFASRLAKALEEYGEEGLAAEVRERFDRPHPSGPAAEADAPQERGDEEQAHEAGEAMVAAGADESAGAESGSAEEPRGPEDSAGAVESTGEPGRNGVASPSEAAADGPAAMNGGESEADEERVERSAEQPGGTPQWRYNGHPEH